MANTWTKGYIDGSALTESMLDTLAGTIQPSQANLAYSTNGTVSGDILASLGSNAAPNWITPNTFAATITATGANAILGVLSSVVASTANLIALNIPTTGADSIIGAASSLAVPTALFANTIVNAANSQAVPTALLANVIVSAANSLSVPTIGLANNIINTYTRSSATAVGVRGVALSPSSSTFETSSTTFVDVTNLTVSIATNGRPVALKLISDGGTISSFVGTGNSGTFQQTAEFQILRGTTTVSLSSIQIREGVADTVNIHRVPPGSIEVVDVVTAGTYTYKVQIKSGDVSYLAQVYYAKLVAYEL